MELMVHDLVRLEAPERALADAPTWVARSLGAAPWAVIRRAAPVAGLAPIGIRGATRSDRFAATVALSDIVELLRPRDLARLNPTRPHAVFEAMAALAPALDASAAGWGPGGAAAFELASRRPTLTDDSDLDLILRCHALPDASLLARLAAAAQAQPVRVDILLETPRGGVSLAELVGGAPELMLRTAAGPRLVERADLIAGALVAGC